MTATLQAHHNKHKFQPIVWAMLKPRFHGRANPTCSSGEQLARAKILPSPARPASCTGRSKMESDELHDGFARPWKRSLSASHIFRFFTQSLEIKVAPNIHHILLSRTDESLSARFKSSPTFFYCTMEMTCRSADIYLICQIFAI
jgi:hypothetical protein